MPGLLAVLCPRLSGWSAGRSRHEPNCWAAVSLVAHNTEFKGQQVQRLDAIRSGQAPPEFIDVDRTSDEVYRSYSQRSHAEVTGDSREVTGALIDGTGMICDDDLIDPSRHPWLKGRQLGLQLIVRGFWHPTGHIGEYYIGHGQPGRAAAGCRS